jgi:hypothetical protein
MSVLSSSGGLRIMFDAKCFRTLFCWRDLLRRPSIARREPLVGYLIIDPLDKVLIRNIAFALGLGFITAEEDYVYRMR